MVRLREAARERQREEGGEGGLRGPAVALLDPAQTLALAFVPPSDLVGGDRDMRNEFNVARDAARVVVMFVSNAEDVEEAGAGSHWSALVVDKQTRVATHFDSMAGAPNEHVARRLTKQAEALLGLAPLSFQKGDGPTQTNGFDCGAYALATAIRVVQGSDSWLTPLDVRARLFDLIEQLLLRLESDET